MAMSRLLKALRHPVQAARCLMPYDYSPPGLERLPESFPSYFPSVVRGRSINSFVPLTGRRDKRFPVVGLCTWDEATILYNYGLMLKEKPFLEVGCWIGWSTVALGLSGTELCVIDPVLGGEPQGQVCRDAIQQAGLSGKIQLHGGFSPQAIEQVARPGQKWSGFFVDGNHEGDGPVQDVAKCHEYAANDSILLLHDMVMTEVCAALRWLKNNGWHTGVHCTSQVIGVAWRGSLSPIRHVPDPSVDWERGFATYWPQVLEFQRI